MSVRGVAQRTAMAAAMCAIAAGLGGCARFSHHEVASKYVYVTAKEASLRDRVAAVSNRTGMVHNGDKLAVLERARRFVKVKAPDGSIGWIEEKLTADQAMADKFDVLKQAHANDPVVAQAVARDDVYLHIAPGRETDHFFRLSEGDSMSLMQRATVEKPLPPGVTAAQAATAAPAKPGEPPPGPVMEDWWLVRDGKGQTGWIYSHMIDVSEPDALSRYSEGQRIVGAYVLTKVHDPESGMVNNGETVTEVPEYVTVTSPFKAGLPYDFDAVRVFTWNVRKHRYETAYRDRNVEGFLPVKIYSGKDPYGKSALAGQTLPMFSYNVLSADAPAPVPDATGVAKPGKTVEKIYRLEETTVHRILPTGTKGPEEGHPVAEAKKEKGKKKR